MDEKREQEKRERAAAIRKHRKECGGKLHRDSTGESTCYTCGASFSPLGTLTGRGRWW